MQISATPAVSITRLAREHKKVLELLTSGPITITRSGTAVAMLVKVKEKREVWMV
jgi:antitoxin (DNA-binding transcriptional repressor) of toxin-antitoxin stability system